MKAVFSRKYSGFLFNIAFILFAEIDQSADRHVGMLLEEFDMDEYIKMERRDSYEDGHEDGLAEGKRLEQLHVVHNLFQKSIPAENCADLLNENTDFVNKIYSLCHAHPDWSDEDIYNALKEK